MITLNLFLFSGLTAATGAAEKPFFEKRVVLSRKLRGAFAIPKLVVTKGDTAVIVAQDRQGGDWGRRIDPVAMRSTDGGRSWSGPSLLVPPDFPMLRESICKPTGIVVNRSEGKVLVFISRSPLRNRDGGTVNEIWFYTHIQETRALGRSWFLVESADDGTTWTRPREVLGQLIKKPHWQEWSPVHTGVELAYGEHKGRLVVPVRCYCPDADPSGHDLRFQSNGVIYSDDGGTTWTPGGRSDPRLGECSIAELSDGSIVMNQRVSPGRKGERWRATSADGGETFQPSVGTGHPDARCHAGLVAIRGADGRDLLLLSNVPGPKRRGLGISVSSDKGKTWQRKRVIHAGHTAYSDLALLRDGTILCVYETGERTSRKDLAVARFNLAWVLGRE